jgi:hypothetical protein
MDDLFKRTLTDVDMYSKVLNSYAGRAMELGLSPKDVTVQRAHLKIDGALNRLMKAEETAKELGYDSLMNALKALRMITDKSGVTDISQLPAVFHKVPKLWRLGRPGTNKTPGFAPLTLRAAIREHKQIVPLLLEAWELADETGRDNLCIEYLKSSAENFKQQLYDFINENEETPLEEQFLDEISKQIELEKYEDWQTENQRMRKSRRK